MSPEHPALVVIDMQNVFADPQSEWATPGFAAITPAVVRLIERFSPRVIFTRFVAPEKPAGAWVDYYARWPFALQPVQSPIWQLVPELDPDSYPVVDRPTFGKWGHTLRDALGDAPGVVLCGVSTDCCVLSTALAAADDGMPVEVVADACAGLSDADHQRALDAMALYGPLITITSEAALCEAALTADRIDGGPG
jgi:nicotinamidase-related amidase